MNEAFAPDWELDYYSRPILESDGKKRWELLICSTPVTGQSGPQTNGTAKNGTAKSFRWVLPCPATSVNSIWLKEALQQALGAAADEGFGPPRRLRCWRGSMRTMVQRAAEGLGLELVASRRCYALVSWLQERERDVYPLEEGYMQGPLAPPPVALRPVAVPLPEAARGESWAWATLPLAALGEANDWEMGFCGLVPLPEGLDPEATVPGIRLFSSSRSLAMAGWIAGLEPVRLDITDQQLVLEAGLDDRWLLTNLPETEADAAAETFRTARERAGGLQFLAVQACEEEPRGEGFWLLRDLPDA